MKMNDTNRFRSNFTLEKCNMTWNNETFDHADINNIVKQMPIYVSFGIITISVSGLLGNVLALIVIFKERLTSQSFLLCCIFLTEFLMLLGFLFFTAFDILGLVFVRDLVILVLECFIGIVSACAAMVGVERSMATLQPIYYRQFWKKRYTMVITALLVILNVALEVGREEYYFRYRKINEIYFRIMEQILRRYAPLICIATTNICMTVGLLRALEKRKKLGADFKNKNNSKELIITKTAFTFVTIYFACMMPGGVTILLTDIGIYTKRQVSLVLQISLMLHLVNASINFVILALSSRHYRKLYKRLVSCSSTNENEQVL